MDWYVVKVLFFSFAARKKPASNNKHLAKISEYHNMFIFFFLQDEKNQLLITNIWLKLVSIKIFIFI